MSKADVVNEGIFSRGEILSIDDAFRAYSNSYWYNFGLLLEQIGKMNSGEIKLHGAFGDLLDGVSLGDLKKLNDKINKNPKNKQALFPLGFIDNIQFGSFIRLPNKDHFLGFIRKQSLKFDINQNIILNHLNRKNNLTKTELKKLVHDGGLENLKQIFKLNSNWAPKSYDPRYDIQIKNKANSYSDHYHVVDTPSYEGDNDPHVIVPAIQAKRFYNYYCKYYELAANDENIDEKMLPNAYGFYMVGDPNVRAKQTFKDLEEQYKIAGPSYKFNHMPFNQSSFKGKNPLNISENRLIGSIKYFKDYGQNILQDLNIKSKQGKLQRIANKHSNIFILPSTLEDFKKSSFKKNFPMGIEIEFDKAIDSELLAISRRFGFLGIIYSLYMMSEQEQIWEELTHEERYKLDEELVEKDLIKKKIELLRYYKKTKEKILDEDEIDEIEKKWKEDKDRTVRDIWRKYWKKFQDYKNAPTSSPGAPWWKDRNSLDLESRKLWNEGRLKKTFSEILNYYFNLTDKKLSEYMFNITTEDLANRVLDQLETDGDDYTSKFKRKAVKSQDLNKFFGPSYDSSESNFEKFIDKQTDGKENENSLIFDIGAKKINWWQSRLLKGNKDPYWQEIEKLVQRHMRPMEEVIGLKPAYSETVFYRIEKRDLVGNLVQNYIIPNISALVHNVAPPSVGSTPPKKNQRKKITLFDTQVKYGKRYIYTIYAVSLVIGNNYWFDLKEEVVQTKASSLGPVTTSTPIIKGDVVQTSTVIDPLAGYPRDTLPVETQEDIAKQLDDAAPGATSPTSVYSRIEKIDIKNIVAYNEPSLKLIDSPVYTFEGVMVDDPPPPPDVNILNYTDVNDKISIFLNHQHGTIRQVPETITPEDGGNLAMIETSQNLIHKWLRYDSNHPFRISETEILFRSEDNELIKHFEVFRMNKKPRDYFDFDGKLYKVLDLDCITNTKGFVDNIESNRKYYYTFRSVDVHGNKSNPTTVFEVELVDDGGLVYMLLKPIILTRKAETQPSINARRYIYITPSLLQKQIGTKQFMFDSKVLKTVAHVKTAKLGPDSKSGVEGVWKKQIKVRITSTKTNRKFDINLSFEQVFKRYNELKKQDRCE